MNVREVMSPHVYCVRPEVPLSETARIMRESRLGCVPVVTSDELLGIVTEDNISRRALAAQDNLSDVTAGDVMTRGTFYCFEDEELEKAAVVMRERKVDYLAVLDRRRAARIVGVVSARDLDQAANRSRYLT